MSKQILVYSVAPWILEISSLLAQKVKQPPVSGYFRSMVEVISFSSTVSLQRDSLSAASFYCRHTSRQKRTIWSRERFRKRSPRVSRGTGKNWQVQTGVKWLAGILCSYSVCLNHHLPYTLRSSTTCSVVVFRGGLNMSLKTKNPLSPGYQGGKLSSVYPLVHSTFSLKFALPGKCAYRHVHHVSRCAKDYGSE